MTTSNPKAEQLMGRERMLTALLRLERETLKGRILSSVEPSSSGCWLWSGPKTKAGASGYVAIRILGGQAYAHRVAYTLWNGPIPDDMTLDHTCRTPRCVNPEHLEPVTIQENTLRGVGPSARNARKTHCPNGHEYTVKNWTKGKMRLCVPCKSAQQRRRIDAKRAAAIDADPGKVALVAALQAMLDVYGELHALYDLGECDATLAARAALRDWQAQP